MADVPALLKLSFAALKKGVLPPQYVLQALFSKVGAVLRLAPITCQCDMI
jgi:hypothetical protein